MKICYTEKNFGPDSIAIIEKANQIIESYAAQGFDLTLRQLYYQFVARDWLPNTERSYKRLGSIVNDGRLAGLISWEAIEDRTRNIREQSHWSDPASIEKDALVGVLDQCCPALDVTYFSCRGYTSQSEVWRAARRLDEMIDAGKEVHIVHLGDHDPSGVDMSRDIEDRVRLFLGDNADQFFLHRIALNMDQVRRYRPPPNPAKITDSRATGYIRRFGEESWELDALDPATLTNLIQTQVQNLRDHDLWTAAVARQERERKVLRATSDRWGEVVDLMGDTVDDEEETEE